MRSIASSALVFAAACSAAPIPAPGEVSVFSDGGAVVQVTACLDSDFIGCHGSDTTLEVTHDGKASAMLYGAFGAGFHAADVPLGDPTTSFVVSDGVAQAEMFLPAPFTISGTPDGTLTRDDHLHLTWDRDSAPMRWDWDYECGVLAGSVDGGEVDDDGAGDFDMSQIADGLADARPSTDTCGILIKLSRIQRGSIDTMFRAKTSTGTQQRSIAFTFVR